MMNGYDKYDVRLSENMMTSGYSVKNKFLGLKQFPYILKRYIVLTLPDALKKFFPLAHTSKVIIFLDRISTKLFGLPNTRRIKFCLFRRHDPLKDAVCLLANIGDAW